MPSEPNFLDPDCKDQWAVELQGGNGRTASRHEAHDLCAIPAKVDGPALAPWMEECDSLTREWIDSRPPSFLSQ